MMFWHRALEMSGDRAVHNGDMLALMRKLEAAANDSREPKAVRR